MAAGTDPVAAGYGPVTRSMARAARDMPKDVGPVQACAVAGMVSDRGDEAAVAAHLAAVRAHAERFEDKVRQAAANNASAHTIGSHKAKVTEARGEHEATLLMMQSYGPGAGDYALLWGFEAGIGIDQLWYSVSADAYIIVEAKGPGAKLSKGSKKGDQMSPEWVANSLDEVKNNPACDAADRRHIRRMEKAMRQGPPPQVLGRVIEARPAGGAFEQPCPAGGVYHRPPSEPRS